MQTDPSLSLPDPQTLAYATPQAHQPRLPNRPATLSLLLVPISILLLIWAWACLFRTTQALTHSRTAIALAAMVTPIFPLILGIIALKRTRSGQFAGKHKAIIGVSLGGVGLLFALIAIVTNGPTSAYRQRVEAANRVRCASNLSQIWFGMVFYANERKGHYPPNLEFILFTQDVTPDVFICPTSGDTKSTGATHMQQAADLSKGGHCSYIYLGKGKTLTAGPKVVLAYEPLSNHGVGMNVIFGGGHTEFLTGAMAKKVEAELQAGQNPPPSHP